MENYLPDESKLDKYFEEVACHDLLKKKEEQELFVIMQKWSLNMAKCGQRTRINGKAAREKLINSNLRLVIKIAKQYKNMGLSLSDLIAEGNMGLMKAVDKYEIGKGAKLSTYASLWIKQCIFRAFDNKSRLVRIPSEAARKYPKIIQWMEDYKKLSGEEPSLQEIAKKFKTTEERILSILQARQGALSIDYKVGEDEGESKTFGEILPDENVSVAKSAEQTNNKEVLLTVLKKLNKRERQIILNRFGIDNHDFHTLEEIGDKFKVSRERIRQLETKALRKLRFLLAKEYQLGICERF